MIFWLIVGIALGYFFKPQIDKLVIKIVRAIRSNAERSRLHDHKDPYDRSEDRF